MISRAKAVALVREHATPVGEFDAEMGVHDSYSLRAVLFWLGY